MTVVEKIVSPFIDQQFPSFYRQDGQNFVAFVRAYYEWLEGQGGALNRSRSLLETLDIDLAEAEFLKYFKDTYLASIPETIVADKRLLVKHVLDLYRTKGSKRAVELLFRILFNEDIEVYIPGDYLLRPSDGVWTKSRYIEVTSHPSLQQLVRKTISNSSRTAFAVVENAISKIVGGKSVNVLYLSSVRGTFEYGDKIVCSGIIEDEDAPFAIGSLTAVPIENGGAGFIVGDILSVRGSGTEGKARVAAVRDENGKVTFNLINGGSGYSLNATVTVATTLNLVVANVTNGTFSTNTSVYSTNTSANGTLVFANTSYLTLINFSSNLQFYSGDTVTNGSVSATVVDVIGGGGSGASFKVGGLVNKEIYQLNSDIINDYASTALETQVRINISSPTGAFTPGNQVGSTGNSATLEVTYLTSNTVLVSEKLSNTTLGIANLFVYSSDGTLISVTGTEADLASANLITGAVLVSNTTSSVVTLNRPADKETITSNGIIFTANSTAVVANVSSGSPYFLPGRTIVDLGNPTSNATVVSQVRLTDWFFPSRTPALTTNLDSRINETLVIYTREVGTIAFLSDVNPGSGYSSPPYVDVIQSDVALVNESDGVGGIKGHNAVVDATVSSEAGVVTAVEVYDSGIGYVPNETVFLGKDGVAASVRGVAVVTRDGSGTGSWRGTRGFISDIMKVQDSDYYQIYSYEVVAERMLSTYEKLANDLVHPAGHKLFGRFRLTRELTDAGSILSNSSISQSNTTVLTLVDREFIANTVTFARASNGTFTNIVNQISTAGVNVPRYNYRGIATYGGLLIEGQRTNAIRNPRAEGAVAGSPGTVPTNWGVSAASAGLTRTISTGTTNGVAWVEIRYAGTATAGAFLTILPENYGAVVASNGQVWTGGTHDLLTVNSGPTPLTEFNVGGTTGGDTSVIQTLSAGGWTRRSATVTLAAASPGSVYQRHVVAITNGLTYDFALRVGFPQLEQAAFSSSLILPPVGTPGASTRGADLVSASLSSLGIPASGACTVLWSGALPTVANANYRIATIHDGTFSNAVAIMSASGTGAIISARTTAGAFVAGASAGTPTASTPFRAGIAIDGSGRAAASFNGGAAQAVTGAPTSGLTTFQLGSWLGAEALFGETTLLRVLPYTLSDAELQAAVAALPL